VAVLKKGLKSRAGLVHVGGETNAQKFRFRDGSARKFKPFRWPVRRKDRRDESATSSTKSPPHVVARSAIRTAGVARPRTSRNGANRRCPALFLFLFLFFGLGGPSGSRGSARCCGGAFDAFFLLALGNDFRLGGSRGGDVRAAVSLLRLGRHDIDHDRFRKRQEFHARKGRNVFHLNAVSPNSRWETSISMDAGISFGRQRTRISRVICSKIPPLTFTARRLAHTWVATLISTFSFMSMRWKSMWIGLCLR